MRHFVGILSVMLLAGISSAADAPLKLSLVEAIKMSAEKNLDVRAELYNPAQFEAEINGKKAIYDPLLSLETSYAGSYKTSITGAGSK